MNASPIRSLIQRRAALAHSFAWAILIAALLTIAPGVRAQGERGAGPTPAATPAATPAPAPAGFSSPIVSPEIGADGRITFRLPAPNAQQVRISASFVPAAASAMEKNEAGIWTLTIPPLSPDIYDYTYNVDGVTVPDPNDNLIEVGSYWFHSLLDVPGEAAAFFAARDVPHGVVHEHWYQSKALGMTRHVLVYTPPGYEAGKSEYPVLYLLHGYGDNEKTWTNWGRVQFIMDNLIAEKKAQPAIIVMPYGHASLVVGRGPGARMNMPSESSVLETELKQNIIPLVEKSYRVKKDAKSRAIAGLSMGGLQSLTIGLNNPDRFAYVAGFSSALRGDAFAASIAGFLAEPKKSNENYKLIWIGCGGDDGLLQGNQQFEALLKSKGIHYESVETPGYGHTWRLWRQYIRDLMPKLFKES